MLDVTRVCLFTWSENKEGTPLLTLFEKWLAELLAF